MSAPTSTSTAPGDAQEAAEAPSLLDTLARAPAAAGLVVGALDEEDDRKALRLAHPQLRDAVGEATTTLEVDLRGAAAARPPTPRRWPRLEELTIRGPDEAAIDALGFGTWGALRALRLEDSNRGSNALSARALAAALRRMPALRVLALGKLGLSEAATSKLFSASMPQLRVLALIEMNVKSAAARALAASGWLLEELDLSRNPDLGAGGVAALVVAPTFAIRRLSLVLCCLDAASVLAVANAAWPLEELDLSSNDFQTAAAAPALAALSRHAGLRRLRMDACTFSPASFKALVERAWPALTSLCAKKSAVGMLLALGAAAFAGFPALEELVLPTRRLDEAGAALLLSRRWPRLKELDLRGVWIGDGAAAGVAALARGEWPALKELRVNAILGFLTLDAARRWAPALEALEASAATLPGE